MQVFFSREGPALIARIKGEVDLSTADRLRKELEDSLDYARALILCLDMEGVSFMDSSGLAVVLGRYRHLKQKGGQVVIFRPQPQVRRLLDLSGLSSVIEIVDSDPEGYISKL